MNEVAREQEVARLSVRTEVSEDHFKKSMWQMHVEYVTERHMGEETGRKDTTKKWKDGEMQMYKEIRRHGLYGRLAEAEKDRDMRGVRPPDGLMTTGNITSGNRTPTLMTAVI